MPRILAVLLVILAITGPAAGRDVPPVFTDSSVAEARERAMREGRLLLVDATAVWCVPCKQMDRTTWVDERVVEWIGARAIAVQFDVDRQEALARELSIQAMPTLIVFRDGAEFDRVVGYRSADELLAWLEGVQQGKRSIDVQREALQQQQEAGEVDVRARLRLAQSLMQRGDHAAAAREYAWLWDHMLEHDRSMYGVRLSFMAAEMKQLAGMHEPARAAFRALRDREQAQVDAGNAKRATITDWYHLNEIIGEAGPVLAWFDRTRSQPDAAQQFAVLDAELFELLGSRGRWADTVHIYAEPAGQAKELVERHTLLVAEEGVDERHRQLVATSGWRFVVEKTARMYAACLAGKRDDVAVQVAETILDYQADAPTLKLLVETALRTGNAREHQLEWIAEAERFGVATGDLRQRVESMLKE